MSLSHSIKSDKMTKNKILQESKDLLKKNKELLQALADRCKERRQSLNS